MRRHKVPNSETIYKVTGVYSSEMSMDEEQQRQRNCSGLKKAKEISELSVLLDYKEYH